MKYKNNRKFLRFWKKYQHDYVDVDKSYGAQCWDLIKLYCIECRNRTPPIVGVVRNATSKYFPADKFKELRVGVDDFEQGDIVIVDLIPQNTAGHIFIVYRQYKYGLKYIDQNGIGGAYKNGKVYNIKGNGVEIRKMRRGDFKILKAFRPL